MFLSLKEEEGIKKREGGQKGVKRKGKGQGDLAPRS